MNEVVIETPQPQPREPGLEAGDVVVIRSGISSGNNLGHYLDVGDVEVVVAMVISIPGHILGHPTFRLLDLVTGKTVTDGKPSCVELKNYLKPMDWNVVADPDVVVIRKATRSATGSAEIVVARPRNQKTAPSRRS